MAIIKLNQSDIENIVKNTIVNESQWNETIETPLNEEPIENQETKTLSMMADQEGNYYVVDWSNPNEPKVVASTKK